MQGLHLTADLYLCDCDPSLFINADVLAKLCRDHTADSGLTLVAEKWHTFPDYEGEPGGVTGMLLLAESHLAVHTWPERNSVTLDVYVCNFMGDNSAKAEQLMQALENAFNRVGLDHVILVKVASTAVCARLMGANREQMLSALSHAFVDGQALRTYRHAPNAGSRKSWAAGDASSRGVRLADIALRGEMGVPGVLTAPQWGFYDVSFSHTNKDLALKPAGQYELRLPQALGSYVMENVLFKVSFPAEFHAQTACEAAVTLHPLVRNRLHEIDRIVITTQESAIRIISKSGPLANAADRDHCLQYMVAVPLIFGHLVAEHYEDAFHANHPSIDRLREKMEVVEDLRFSREYLEPDKRSIANALQVFFKDGSSTDQVVVEYPIGHRRRRGEGIPLLEAKFRANLGTRFARQRCAQIVEVCKDQQQLEGMAVHRFVDLFVI